MTNPQNLERISDIAYGMATSRAIETERPDAHFRDPFARQLGGERGERFLEGLGGSPRGRGLAIAIRTCLIDEIILQLVAQNEIDAVLNLAAGFDTRPYRMALPASLRWVEVDLPEIMIHKQTQLSGVTPVCSVQSIALDLTNATRRADLFAQVSATANRVLIITEGLLAYLPADQVTALANDLRAYYSFRWWVTELASPLLLKAAQKVWGDQLSTVNARLQFAPPNGADFFRSSGWHPHQFKRLLHEARRLNRDVPYGWLLRKLPMINDGVVLLKQSD